MFDAAGRPYAVCGIDADITERKRAEQTIKEARDEALRERNRLETILNTIPSGVFVAEGPDAGITIQNQQAIMILGRGIDQGTPGERIISTLKCANPDGTLFTREEIPYIRSLLTGAIVRQVEMTLKRPDGRQVVDTGQRGADQGCERRGYRRP